MPKTPIHFVSEEGAVLPLALTLQREGHPVTLRVLEPSAARIGRGLIPHAVTPPPRALVIFDSTGQARLGTQYRNAGHRVIGGNRFENDLELDRPKGAALMRKVGIETPPTFPFTSIPRAITFLKKATGSWFVKVSGSQMESSTYDAPDPDAMIRYLEWVASKGTPDPFELQQKVNGVEVSCEGWFNGREFVPPFALTIEEKHFLVGDLGPRTGCESCVVWHADDDALAERTVILMEEVLAKENYVGPLDVNSKIDGDTLYGLEFTARLGFDATQAWMRLFEDDLGEQLEAFAAGELDEWEPAEFGRLSATLRLSIPPYPSNDEDGAKAQQGLPLDPALLGDPFIDPVDVEAGPVCAGAHGWIGNVGGIGESLRGLREGMLERCKGLLIPNAQYRTDPIRRADRDFAALDRLGLLGLKGWQR